MNLIGKRVVASRNRNRIRKDTYQLRKKLGLLQTEYFPIMRVLENVLPVLYPGFYIELVEVVPSQGAWQRQYQNSVLSELENRSITPHVTELHGRV